jgi:hypothetical protein
MLQTPFLKEERRVEHDTELTADDLKTLVDPKPKTRNPET